MYHQPEAKSKHISLLINLGYRIFPFFKQMFINKLATEPMLFIWIVLMLIISITLHELAHGLAAMIEGDDTPQISGHLTLNPVVHMGWESLIFLCIAGIAWGQMPVNPAKFRRRYSDAIVSAAGPLCNLALALLFVLLLKLTGGLHLAGFFSSRFLYLAARLNLILCLFNLLPIPPLDGFRIFSDFIPELRALENSQFRLFAFMILYLIPGFWLTLSAIADSFLAVAMGS